MTHLFIEVEVRELVLEAEVLRSLGKDPQLQNKPWREGGREGGEDQHTCVCMCAHVCVRMCVCVCVCVCVREHIGVCDYKCVYVLGLLCVNQLCVNY